MSVKFKLVPCGHVQALRCKQEKAQPIKLFIPLHYKYFLNDV